MLFATLDKIAAKLSAEEIPIISDIFHAQNSNTAVRVMVESAGLKYQTPMCDDEPCNVPGVDSSFKDTTFDKVLKSFKEKAADLTPEQRETLLIAFGVSILGIFAGIMQSYRICMTKCGRSYWRGTDVEASIWIEMIGSQN